MSYKQWRTTFIFFAPWLSLLIQQQPVIEKGVEVFHEIYGASNCMRIEGCELFQRL